VTDETVTSAVPKFVRVIGTLAVVFIRMLPNETLVTLGVSVPTGGVATSVFAGAALVTPAQLESPATATRTATIASKPKRFR